MYAIVDIETTGGSPVTEKITEIAVYIFDGKKVVDEFISLINPEKSIPYHISSLTGITNAMVADAPKFYEVARQVVEITRDCIFVAHNVSFDYRFILNEFKYLGFEYKREKLCTVQLSRRIIPGMPSYSLGKICKQLGIQNNARHRAAGDAMATVKLFDILLQQSGGENGEISKLTGIDQKDLHPAFSPEKIKSLPEEAGVYYFFNDKSELIYIGKSKNIHNRVLSHFRNFTSKKAIEMRSSIADIDFELTGSELVALLKESHEIKRDIPRYNRSQRRTASHYGLYFFIDSQDYINLVVAKNSGRQELPLTSFASQKAGKTYLQNLVEEFDLCQKLCALYPSSGACFHYEIEECKGACIGKESPQDYNARVQRIIDKHQYEYESFYILDTGRTPEELAVVEVDCGKYIGYGYIDKAYYGGAMNNLHACIQPYPDNRDIQQILRLHLRKSKNLKVIPFQAYPDS